MMFGLMEVVFVLLVILVLIGGIVLVVWAIRRFSDSGPRPTSGQTPREIVQARYARGEITREQYQQMLDDLK